MKDEEIVIPKGLEKKLENLIDRMAEQEAQSKRRQLRIWTGSIAAGIALLLSLGIFFQTQNKQKHLTAHNIENPELAYIEAQKALKQVSLKFNKGMNQLAFVSEEMDKTNQILNKTFKK